MDNSSDNTKPPLNPASDSNNPSTEPSSPTVSSNDALTLNQPSLTNPSVPSQDIKENNASLNTSEDINLHPRISPPIESIKIGEPIMAEKTVMNVQNPTSDLPNESSFNQQDSGNSSSGDTLHKSSKLILPIAVLSLGIMTGALLYFGGFLKNNTLRLGDYTSKQPASVIEKQKNKLIVGTDATYPPMEFKDENGILKGYDIELANEIGAEMKYDIEFKDIAFDNIFDKLDSKEIDVIISSVTITSERSQEYNFSEPYLNAGQVIVARREVEKSFTSPEELKGKLVGVQKGTTSEEEALKYTSRNLVIAYSDYTQAVAALSNKSIDALIVDLTAAKGIVDEHPDLVIVSDPFTNEFYGVVFRKEDTELKAQIDEIILSLQKRGIINNIKQKWFH